MKRLLIVVFWLAVGTGCAAQGASSMVSMHQDAPLAHYSLIEIAPVSNDVRMGSTDAAALLAQDLHSEFVSLGYTVADNTSTAPDALILRCAIMKYNPGNFAEAWAGMEKGHPSITIKTALIDKKTDTVVGTMLTPVTIHTGDVVQNILFPITIIGTVAQSASPIDQNMMSYVAKGIADEIDKRLKNG